MVSETDPFEFEDDGDGHDLDLDDFDTHDRERERERGGGGKDVFGSTLRSTDQFWLSSYDDPFDEHYTGRHSSDEEDDFAMQMDRPGLQSSPVHDHDTEIEDFADFSAFDAMSPSPQENQSHSPPSHVEDNADLEDF